MKQIDGEMEFIEETNKQYYFKKKEIFEVKKLKSPLPIDQPYIRANIIGIILLFVGAGFLFFPNSINTKIGFASMLIGILWIILVTEKSIPNNIYNAQVQGIYDVLEKMIKEYNLDGNAIILPKTDALHEEKIYIPKNKFQKIIIPKITHESLIIKNAKSDVLGITLPPSGINLFKEIEKELDIENIGIKNVEERLQKFIGLNLANSIKLIELKDDYRLEIEKPVFCKFDQNLCRQYPCPTCSAALIAIIRSTKKILWIKNVMCSGKTTTFDFNFLKRKSERVI